MIKKFFAAFIIFQGFFKRCKFVFLRWALIFLHSEVLIKNCSAYYKMCFNYFLFFHHASQWFHCLKIYFCLKKKIKFEKSLKRSKEKTFSINSRFFFARKNLHLSGSFISKVNIGSRLFLLFKIKKERKFAKKSFTKDEPCEEIHVESYDDYIQDDSCFRVFW